MVLFCRNNLFLLSLRWSSASGAKFLRFNCTRTYYFVSYHIIRLKDIVSFHGGR